MNKECPKCGSDMVPNYITNTWDCAECGYQIDDIDSTGIVINSDEVLETSEVDDIDNEVIQEETEEIKQEEDSNYTLCHCNNCNISFIGENIDNCFICGSNIEKSTTNADYLKYIDFKLDLGDALHNYKRKLFLRLLCPYEFRTRKTINKIKGIYVPMYLFDSNLNGDVVFNASDLNVLDSSKKNKKMQYYKVLCNGHFDYDDVLINGSSRINNSLLEKIDDFDYSELKEIDSLNLGEKIIYKEDCDEYSIFDRLKKRCVNNSVKLMGELVNHTKKKVVDNKLDFKYDKKGIVLVPVYFLINNYKGKEYPYIMNGQNGNTYIKTPIGIIETIIFSILLFSVLFAIMLLIAILI